MKLVLLESPTKTRALQKFLGAEYLVFSSNGHIYKMEKAGVYQLGIDWKTYQPLYQVDKTKHALLKQLKQHARKASVVYLATDPDREGEAIADHLSQILPKTLPQHRILFNEITADAVLAALQKPQTLNGGLIAAQSARRILDRMIGFRLSKLLQQKLFAKSAGRVQSVALHLLATKERAIAEFVATPYWKVMFSKNTYQFNLTQFSHPIPLTTLAAVKSLKTVLAAAHGTIVKSEKRFKTTAPPQFLTTSKLLQLAARRLRFSVKKTTFIAQKLYEGIKVANNHVVGFITYPRTDSTRINPQFVAKSRQFLAATPFAKHLNPTLAQPAEQQGNVQDAHEAIRITDWNMTPTEAAKYLTKEGLKLYELIYAHTQMAFLTAARSFVHHLTYVAKTATFVAEKEFLVDPGFLAVEQQVPNAQDYKPWTPPTFLVPPLTITRKMTLPPARFSEGELIRVLDKNGIGRPSTYSQIVEKIITSLYVAKIANRFEVTPKGLAVDQFLQTHFPEIINEAYTAQCEKKFDEICENPQIRVPFLTAFWTQFNAKVQTKQKALSKPAPKPLADQVCPKCQNQLVEREGRYGKFISCQTYPRCNYTRPLKVPPLQTAHGKCPDCQNALVERAGKYGAFIGCSAYPTCKYLQKSPPAQAQNVTVLETLCPRCQAPLVHRVGRYGPFVSCSKYPKCRYRPPKTASSAQGKPPKT